MRKISYEDYYFGKCMKEMKTKELGVVLFVE